MVTLDDPPNAVPLSVIKNVVQKATHSVNRDRAIEVPKPSEQYSIKQWIFHDWPLAELLQQIIEGFDRQGV